LRLKDGANPLRAAVIALASTQRLNEADDLMVRGLGIWVGAGRIPAEVTLTRLGNASTVLVIDNCEQVLGAVAQVIAGLMEGAPGLRVLATTREPLGPPGGR